MISLETPRLVLCPLRHTDAEEFAALNGDTAVMRHFPARLSRDESDAMLARLEARWREDGIAFAGAFLRETGALAGMVGLMHVRPDMPFAPAVEIGWRIATAHQRQGLAEEAARAWIAHGFGALGLSEIIAFTVPANEPSWRMMEKLGMQRGGEFDHPGLPEGHALRRHLLYRLARP
ncbi:GNAT family N-acetyltransferase [Sabulicella rubraurantiaca]|uniref:GNAT family N-acetyltransferase n=1 Tax=Sabulicella rubraurantiaca TaxID=2811429 RepID=UPI001A96A250|nr:GNAT family N-acetyltransferase [Sabulicella rubraurantiaca]